MITDLNRARREILATHGVHMNERMTSQYIEDLELRVRISYFVVACYLIGAFAFIPAAFRGVIFMELPMLLGIWLVTLIVGTLLLGAVKRKIHSIEKFHDFFDRRHAVRHDLVCARKGGPITTYFYCMSLHYFGSLVKSKPEPENES